MPVTAQLILIQGDPNSFQQVIELHTTDQSIGRAQNCDIAWGSLQISRRHATLEYIAPKWYIRDTSTNGLSVNNIKLTKGELFPLKDADIISFIPTGAVRYRFRYVTSTPPGAAAQTGSRPQASTAISAFPPGPPSPIPSTSSLSVNPPSLNSESRNNRPSIEEVLVDSDAESDVSNRSESLLSVEPPLDDFYSFSNDDNNDREDAPSPGPEPHGSNDDDSSNAVFVPKRKHNADSSDSDNNAVDRKKTKVQKPIVSIDSSDDEDSRPSSSAKSNDAVPSTSSNSRFKTLRMGGGGSLMMTDEEIDNCEDLKELKQKLRGCMTKLSKAEVEIEALQCERDMEREEFRRKENDVQSVNEAFKEETFKKVLEVMESELACAVCNEVFIQATVVDCGHTFCSFCINEWARKKLECPICRKAFRNRSRHIEVENFITKVFESLSSEIAAKRKLSIKEREDQAKKAAEDARAAADQAAAARAGNLHNVLQAGRYDFLAELHQINEIFNPRGGGGARAEAAARRRSQRIQDRIIDAVATGTAGPGGRGGRGRRRNAATAGAGANNNVANPPAGPTARAQGPGRQNANNNPGIQIVTLNDSTNDEPAGAGIGGLRFPNQFINYVRNYNAVPVPPPPIPHIADFGFEDLFGGRAGNSNRN